MRITRGRRIGRVTEMPLFQGVITGTMPRREGFDDDALARGIRVLQLFQVAGRNSGTKAIHFGWHLKSGVHASIRRGRHRRT